MSTVGAAVNVIEFAEKTVTGIHNITIANNGAKIFFIIRGKSPFLIMSYSHYKKILDFL